MHVSYFYYNVWFYGITSYTDILFRAIDIEQPVVLFGRIIFDITHDFYKCTIFWTYVVFEVVACVIFSSVQDTKGCFNLDRRETHCKRVRIFMIKPV